MRLLVVHAWLRGNLGDILQASVLLRSLRELKPAALDLAAFPARPGDYADELLSLADRYLPEPFLWYWRYAPDAVRARWIAPTWRKRRAALFSGYDAIVSSPGPFLAEYDARAPSALCDLTLASELGIPFILSSHSVGPLTLRDLEPVRKTTLRVARESATHRYLARHGIESVSAADLAFLYPFAEKVGRTPTRDLPTPYRLLFLRSNNLAARSIDVSAGALRCGELRIALAPGERIVLATSDFRRDGRFLSRLSKRLGVPSVACRTVDEFVSLVAGSSGVISDRYHPAICAAAFGKPANVLPNREPHKMSGLQSLLDEKPLSELQALARGGLLAVNRTLTRARGQGQAEVAS